MLEEVFLLDKKRSFNTCLVLEIRNMPIIGWTEKMDCQVAHDKQILTKSA